MYKIINVCSVGLLLLVTEAFAYTARGPSIVIGDDDYYPMSCVTFGGEWVNEKNKSYSLKIEQKDCSRISIATIEQSILVSKVLLKPNGKFYETDFGDYVEITRGRWNSLQHGSALEVLRDVRSEREGILEHQILQSVGDNKIFMRGVRYIFVNGREVDRVQTFDWFLRKR